MEKVANEIIAVALQLGASETDAKGSDEEVSSLSNPLDKGS
jgi:hypothetical protein